MAVRGGSTSIYQPSCLTYNSAAVEPKLQYAHTEDGEVLVSDVVRQLVAGKGFLFADREDAELRGFDDPVRIYELRWREG